MDIFLGNSGKLLSITTENKSSTQCIIALHVNKYEERKRAFSEVAPTVCPSLPFGAKIISFTSCLELLTDINIPVFLTEVQRGSQFVYYFVGCSLDYSKACVLRKLETSSQIKNCIVVDGPTVVWNDDDLLLIGKTSKQNQCHLTKYLIDSDVREADILWSKYQSYNYVIIGKCQNKTNKDKNLFLYICSTSLLESEPARVEKCDISQIIPPLYSNLCRILVLDFEINCRNDTSFEISCTVFAVTEDGYILKFSNGQILYAYPSTIKCDLNTQIFFQKCIPLNRCYLCIFANGNLNVINFTCEKITQSWSNVKQVLCDDFIGNGSQQLLILLKDFDGKSGFILTDFDINHIDATSGSSTKEEIEDMSRDNTKYAVSALQSRLRNEVVYLNDLQSDIEQRRLHIADLWTRTESLNQGNLVADTNNSMLINLVGPECSLPTQTRRKPVEIDLDVKVYDIWKRIIQKTLVVGVEIRNISNRPLLVTMTVSPAGYTDPPAFIFMSECYDLEKSSNKDANPALKKRKISLLSVTIFKDAECVQLNPGKMATCVCQTAVPRFSVITDIKYKTFIHINGWDERNTTNVYCGEITLAALDILKQNHAIVMNDCMAKDNSVLPTDLQRDIIAMNSVQICTQLIFISTRFPLSQLQSWLYNKAAVTYLKKYECLICDGLPLDGARMYIDNKGDGKQVDITLYTSCKNQLYLLLHHLYSVLPDDVIMLPSNQIHEDIKVLLDSLQEEVTSAITSITKVQEGQQLCDDIEMREECDEKGKVNFDNVRQNFVRRKILIQNKTKLSITGFDWMKTSVDLEQKQFKSDINLIKLTT